MAVLIGQQNSHNSVLKRSYLGALGELVVVLGTFAAECTPLASATTHVTCIVDVSCDCQVSITFTSLLSLCGQGVTSECMTARRSPQIGTNNFPGVHALLLALVVLGYQSTWYQLAGTRPTTLVLSFGQRVSTHV